MRGMGAYIPGQCLGAATAHFAETKKQKLRPKYALKYVIFLKKNYFKNLRSVRDTP